MQATLGSALVFEGHVKRKAETNATLCAYGGNISAWPIAYGLTDGEANHLSTQCSQS